MLLQNITIKQYAPGEVPEGAFYVGFLNRDASDATAVYTNPDGTTENITIPAGIGHSWPNPLGKTFGKFTFNGTDVICTIFY